MNECQLTSSTKPPLRRQKGYALIIVLILLFILTSITTLMIKNQSLHLRSLSDEFTAQQKDTNRRNIHRLCQNSLSKYLSELKSSNKPNLKFWQNTSLNDKPLSYAQLSSSTLPSMKVTFSDSNKNETIGNCSFQFIYQQAVGNFPELNVLFPFMPPLIVSAPNPSRVTFRVYSFSSASAVVMMSDMQSSACKTQTSLGATYNIAPCIWEPIVVQEFTQINTSSTSNKTYALIYNDQTKWAFKTLTYTEL